MAVSFRQAGKLIEYTATEAVDYHAVVQIGSLIGITRKSAEAGEKFPAMQKAYSSLQKQAAH